ncbi:hypothetical protein CCMA1212_008556 [Trichoderma ghanense]|uniref:Peptidase S8/S53 domain-containing protein n=1 Tax=Trichoderma ghanense TaxID=65468 RepID=A0ABY2GVA9_9HYPO
MTDPDGHGTHCCNLVFKTAPYAKVYPLKVFKSARREDISPELVGKIRGNSLRYRGPRGGYHLHVLCIYEGKASYLRRTERSKDENQLRNKEVKARSDVRSGLKPLGSQCRNTNDEKSSFSPHGIRGAANLSAVGEDVCVACPKSNGGPWKRISGTSLSTPIVAGVAPMLLDFATKELKGLEERDEWNKKRG